MVPHVVCCLYIYLISHLNGMHIVAIAPRLELNRHIRKSLHNVRFAPSLSVISKHAFTELVT